MNITGKTDIGRLRRANQDAFCCGELPGNAVYAVVCDGMGGANGGDIASSNAVKIIKDYVESSYREDMNSNSVKALLQSSMCGANVRLHDIARTIPSLSGMGTTAVAVIVSENIAHIAHLGDSRAYLIRGGEITQITKDHSVVQSMVDCGQITKEQARNHPRKNVITRALGIKSEIEAEYNEIDFFEDDKLLICSDGLTNYVEDAKIAEVLSNNSENAAETLINLANEAGGGDNITLVIIS